jgi:acyl carrier protein
MQIVSDQEIEHKVTAILASLCKRAHGDIQLNNSLVNDLGVDSIQFLELLAMLEEQFSFEMEVDDLRPELFRSVRSVIHLVKERVHL